MSQATCTWDNTTASRKRTRTKRYNEESWQAGRHTPNTGISSKATLPSAWRDRCTTPVCCQLWHMVQRPGHWPNKHRTNLRPHRPKMERSMLNITYKDRRANIWVRERTKLIDIIYTVRKMKWSWAGHINRLKDDRWTSRVTTWRPYDKKRRQGDQPSGRGTTWTNTGAARYGRGQHKTGSFGDDMLKPSPNHGTQRLPNDEMMILVFKGIWTCYSTSC